MSKLIFPDHGGVLVDDHTYVAAIFDYNTRRGRYLVKIVKYPSGHKPYGYHYLDPEGAVTGSNSGHSYDPDDAAKKAVESIRESERGARLARHSRTQKKTDALKRKIDFFLRHGGSSRGPGESERQGKLRSATALARAERHGEEMDWKVLWQPDPEPYDMGDDEGEPPSEVLTASLLDAHDNVLASLSSIGDPSDNYKRVVEAELALEAMEQQGQ